MDEFHHAAAATYRRLIDYFTPKFLLGLTATPERTDGGDLLALCEENLVYRCDLAEGIDAGLLCPFDYFGVPDDRRLRQHPLAQQPVRRGGADQGGRHAVAGGERARAVPRSAAAADARVLRLAAARGLHGAVLRRRGCARWRSTPGRRARRGRIPWSGWRASLDVVFAVDMFNEGVDLPAVDTVMMLRPTESQILWLQQFGRGLRRREGKQLTRHRLHRQPPVVS